MVSTKCSWHFCLHSRKFWLGHASASNSLHLVQPGSQLSYPGFSLFNFKTATTLSLYHSYVTYQTECTHIWSATWYFSLYFHIASPLRVWSKTELGVIFLKNCGSRFFNNAKWVDVYSLTVYLVQLRVWIPHASHNCYPSCQPLNLKTTGSSTVIYRVYTIWSQ